MLSLILFHIFVVPPDSFEEIDPDDNYLFESFINTCCYHSVEEFISKSRQTNMLNILNYNIRSFRMNSDPFLTIVEQSKPQIVVITETWFTEDFQASIPGYDSYHSIRPHRSGGVSIYVSDALKSCKLNHLSYVDETIELCTIEDTCTRKNCIF